MKATNRNSENDTLFFEKMCEVVDEEFRKLTHGISTRAIAHFQDETIEKISDRMKAETTAYIGLKTEMFKKMVKKLNSIE